MLELSTLDLAVFFAVLAVASNNLSACVGTVIGANVLGRRSAKLLGAAGIILGLTVQGSTMSLAIPKLFPLQSSTILLEALIITIIAFLAAKLMKAPLSLSMALVGLLIGVSNAHHLQMNYSYVTVVVIMWLLSPLVSMIAAFLLEKLIIRTRPRAIWRRVELYKMLLIISAVLASYALGANTVGLIAAIGGDTPATRSVVILAILIGGLGLSDREINRVGEDMFSLRYSTAFGSLLISTILVELATFFSIPLSSTQTLSASVIGTAVGNVHKLVSLRPFLIIVTTWIIVPLACFLVGHFL